MNIKILFPVLLLWGMAFGQVNFQAKIDSLNKVLVKTKTDSVKVKTLIQLSRNYQYAKNTEAAFLKSEAALALATKIRWDSGIVQSYAAIADNHMGNFDVENGRIYLFKALDAAKKSNDVLAQARINKSLGSSFSITDYNKAVVFFDAAFALFEKLKMYKECCEILLNAGGLHQRKGNYYAAADAYQKMMKYGEKAKDPKSTIYGVAYLSTIYELQENDVKAQEYLLKSLALQDKSKPKDQAMYNATLIKLGQVHARAKKYDKAFEYFNKAYTGADKLHDYGSKASYALIMSSAYRKKGDMAKAVLYFDKAVAASNLIVNDDFTKVQVIIYLAGTQFDNGNYELALEYSKKAFALAKQLPVNYFVNVTMGNVGAAMVNLAKGKHGKEKAALLTEGIAYIEKATVVTGNMLSLDDMQLYSKYLYEAYEMQGNTAKAFKSYRNYIVYRDSVENKTKRDEFTNRQFEYEYGQKETTLKAKQKLALEQEQANRNYAFAGVGVLLLIAGGAGVAYSRKRKDNRIIAAEKKRSDDLLLNILPAEVAEELKAKGEASAQYYDQVSILFTDFVGFTKLSEKFSPEELIGELNYCFKAFDNIITKHNIEKIKTIGDSYMAVSGLPGKNPDHAKNAVEAAIEMRNFIDNYKTERQALGKVYFEMRTGINSGNVVAGIVGIKKFAYDVWGDAVNIASRMESNGQAGKINISESTYNLVKDDYEVEYRGELEAKGKGLIKMYFVEPK